MPDHDLAAVLQQNLVFSRRAVGLINMLLASLDRRGTEAEFVITRLSVQDLRQALADRQNDDATLLAAYCQGRDEGRAAGREAGYEAGRRDERDGRARLRRVAVPDETQPLARRAAVIRGNLELSRRAIDLTRHLFALLGQAAPEAEFVGTSLSIRELRQSVVDRQADDVTLLAAYRQGRDEGRAAGFEAGYRDGRSEQREGRARLRLAASQ